MGRKLRSLREVLGEARSSREERSSTRKQWAKANSGRGDRLPRFWAPTIHPPPEWKKAVGPDGPVQILPPPPAEPISLSVK